MSENKIDGGGIGLSEIEFHNINKYKDILQLPGEIWKDIPDFEGVYEVSNYGRIKKLEILKPDKILKNTLKENKYLIVTLNFKKERKTFYVHRLVGAAFLENKANKPEINHKNGNKHNNTTNNLEWNYHYENMEHAQSNFLLRKACVRKIFTIDEIKEIRNLYNANPIRGKIMSLAKRYNSNHATISRIIRNKIWKHVKI